MLQQFWAALTPATLRLGIQVGHEKMQRYRVSCYGAKDEHLTDSTIEAPNQAVAEMMVLTQLHGASMPLADRVHKFVARPEGETAGTEPAFDDGATQTANEARPIEPSGARPACDDDIRIYDPEKIAGLASSSGAQIARATIIAGTLSVTVGLAWIGWNSLHSAGDVPSASSVDQKPASSAPNIDSDRPISTQSARIGEASQQPMQVIGVQGKIDIPVSGSSGRDDANQSTVQPFSRTKTAAVVQQKNPAASSGVHNKPKTQPTPFPETKPATIDGWVIREVSNGRAVLQGPNGVWKVARGDTVPGLGTVDSIVLWGNRWIVSTSRGLITTQ